MDLVWTIIGVVVLAAVALLFIVDALQHHTVAARVAALLTLVAGVMFGAELWTPWGPIAVLGVAFSLGVAGRVGEDDDVRRSRPRAKAQR